MDRRGAGKKSGFFQYGIVVCVTLLVTLSCGCSSEQQGDQKYIEQGIAQYNEGRFNDALWSFERYLITDENSTTASYAWAWKGITYEELGKYDQALSCIDRALRIRPEDPEVWRAKERILLHLGRNEEAAQAGKIAASLAGPSATLSFTPTFTAVTTSPAPTVSRFTERDRSYIRETKNQTLQLSTLSLQAANLTPSDYRSHGALFQSTANTFLKEVEKSKPDDPDLIRSWEYYRDALRQFSQAGMSEEQAGKDFAANDFAAMTESLHRTVQFMEEGNANLTLSAESIDRSGFTE
ncbi:MAG: tetratricopeptide repeat protein [Methanomicrobiales archaeon]|nr:tetratricopeptide repeat protein [Methanomicrobiales archaeon]